MEQVDRFLVFTTRLEASGIPYMVTGSVAGMMYGTPRFTHDIDVVAVIPHRDIGVLEASFPPTDFYCPPREVLLVECRRPYRGHFNLIHHATGFKADIYVHGESKLEAWGLERKRRVEVGGGAGLWLAPPEYVIVRKLEFFREGHSEKHLHDIAGMLEVSGDLVDRGIVSAWVAELGLQGEWGRAQAATP